MSFRIFPYSVGEEIRGKQTFLVGYVSLLRRHSSLITRSGKPSSWHMPALSSHRCPQTPTEFSTTAAQGDHGYDVRTLETNKPAVASSVPLIWMLWMPDTNVQSRLSPAVFTYVFHITRRLTPWHWFGADCHRCCSLVLSLLPHSSSLGVFLRAIFLFLTLSCFYSNSFIWFCHQAGFSAHSCVFKFLVTRFIGYDVKTFKAVKRLIIIYFTVLQASKLRFSLSPSSAAHGHLLFMTSVCRFTSMFVQSCYYWSKIDTLSILFPFNSSTPGC